MAKRKISLEQWCKENSREDLLREWSEEKNSVSRFPMSPSAIEYSTALNAWWKCKDGHEWRAPVQKRTTFGLDVRFVTRIKCLSRLAQNMDA